MQWLGRGERDLVTFWKNINPIIDKGQIIYRLAVNTSAIRYFMKYREKPVAIGASDFLIITRAIACP
jgi:hypothetical protein